MGHKASSGWSPHSAEGVKWGLNPQLKSPVELLCLDYDQPFLWFDCVAEQCWAVGPEVPVELG